MMRRIQCEGVGGIDGFFERVAHAADHDIYAAAAVTAHLQPLPTALLLAIAQGRIDVQRLAAEALANRGLGLAGEWVGFDTARKLWEVE